MAHLTSQTSFILMLFALFAIIVGPISSVSALESLKEEQVQKRPTTRNLGQLVWHQTTCGTSETDPNIYECDSLASYGWKTVTIESDCNKQTEECSPQGMWPCSWCAFCDGGPFGSTFGYDCSGVPDVSGLIDHTCEPPPSQTSSGYVYSHKEWHSHSIGVAATSTLMALLVRI